MPIQSGDVKLLKSAVMADVPEGGGAPTGLVIPDGLSNAILPDISELDRAVGRVNLRKAFVSVQTDDADTYFGGNLIVAEPPQDPRVSITLFSNRLTFDTRQQAASRVEAYLNKGSEWSGYLFENHIAGQRVLQLFQRPEAKAPNIGETIVLLYQEGTVAEKEQYVRATRVSSEIRKFYDESKVMDYDAAVVTVELSDSLRHDFKGSPPSRTFLRNKTDSSVVRETVVADAGTYVGVVPLTKAAALGDFVVSGKNMFTQLVPSAQTETPVIDMDAAGQVTTLITSDNGPVTYTTGQVFSYTTTLSVGNAIYPGSLNIAASGVTLTDSGSQLYDGSTVVATIDYARGIIQFVLGAPTYNGSKTINFTPAAAPLSVQDTASLAVTPETRSYNWTLTIVPPPAPGSLLVSYRANGRWYDLRDGGAGVLNGRETAYGVGTINYASGTCTVTCGAMPDAGSAIMFAWGNRATYVDRAKTFALPKVQIPMALQRTDIQTLANTTIAWNDGTARLATVNSVGRITGDAKGTMSGNRIDLIPDTLPAPGQQFTVQYLYGQPTEADIPDLGTVGAGGEIVLDVGATDLSPGTVSFSLTVTRAVVGAVAVTGATSNGYGGLTVGPLIEPQPDMGLPYNTDTAQAAFSVRDDGFGILTIPDGTVMGLIDYDTGIASINLGLLNVGYYHQAYAPTTTTVPATTPDGADTTTTTWRYVGTKLLTGPAEVLDYATVRHYSLGAGNVDTETFTLGQFEMDFGRGYTNTARPIVPGSIAFTLGDKRYFDSGGALYTDLNVTTGYAPQAGTINYSTGRATIHTWEAGVSNALALQSLLVNQARRPVNQLSFRIPVSPVRVGSVQVLATTTTGTLINVTADLDGIFNTADVTGKVDYETGVVRLMFRPRQFIDHYGKLISDDVYAFADTVRYNAVSYSYLPLDASLLGIDPVRLPQDGRVPIFRPGGLAVVGHTGEISATVSNGQTINCARVRLSRVRVVGSDGVVINTGYTADLEAGTVTFTDVTGYAQPVKIQHRIEDMAVVRDAQINGDITFTRPLTHDYPLGSYVSSALVAGDLFARVQSVFDQKSWDGKYTDAPVGDPATGTFNNAQFPVAVTNRGALTERWVVRFTNTTAFEVIGENVGVIATGNVATDCAPINPATGVPYFTIPALGWGLGWAAGNIMRINTIGAMFPVWIVRTVQQGPETVTDDNFTLLIRGDVNTEPVTP
ncbi:MAG: hypothetical protein PHX60_13360 [Giesbergeria sp.]|uniref:hypothetical protein n=1 Tax=Giesbergeria sp. TaxID=2818473 RepID=UPI002615164A|nr:hypothetical protein [Giesbergeria sp.]MDD2610648.1 hypothetical protein [Giesbergeria sp.]